MKHASINGMGFKGLNSDQAPWELPPEFINTGRNFRLEANKIISVGANESLTIPAAPFYGAHILPVSTSGGDFWLALGRSAIWVYDGTTWTDLSSAAGYTGISADGELNWTSCMLGAIPIVNNPQHVPEYWSPQQTSQIMQPLQFDASNTWAAKGFTFDAIRSHKNFLFALSLTEGGVELPSAYRWSHPADINGLPFTWDETDASGIAGKAQIGGDTGRLLEGKSLRDAFALYSETGVNLLDFKGDEFVWSRRELSSAFGIMNKNCVSEIKGTHFLLGDGDIVRNDGNRLDSIVHNRIRKRLTSQMSADYYDRSYVVRDTALKELWFCVPEDGAQYPNTVYIYNWRDDSWSIHSLPYSEDLAGVVTSGIAFADYGSQAEPPTRYSDMTASDTYDTTLLTYGSQKRTPLNSTVVGIDVVNSELTVLDPINVTPTEDTDFFIERTDIALEGHENVTTITRVYPFMSGNSPVSIQFGSQEFAGGPVKWKPAVTFDPSTQRKFDVRTSGKLHAYRIMSIGTGSVSATGMNVEYEFSGKR